MLMRDEMAGIGRRVVALLVDVIMLELAMIPLALGLREMTPSPVSVRVLELAVAVVYSTVFLTGRGQTPGKTLAALRIIGPDGGNGTQAQAVKRSLIKWTIVFLPMIAMTAIAPFPTNVQYVTIDAPAVAEAIHPLAAVIPIIALALWMGMMLYTRRHPDGQAPHDAAAGPYVMRVQ